MSRITAKITMMKAQGLLLAALVVIGCAALPSSASADSGPSIVVRGRADIPVLLYGRDISGAVVEGDWGLSRPGAVTPTVIPAYAPLGWDDGSRYAPYFPATGRRPRYGRREAPVAARRHVEPAPSYVRTWGAASDPLPASSAPSYDMRDLPPVVLAPRAARNLRRGQTSSQP